MIEIVLALFTFDEICVFCVETMLRLILLSLLLLLFWLLLMLAMIIHNSSINFTTVSKQFHRIILKHSSNKLTDNVVDRGKN